MKRNYYWFSEANMGMFTHLNTHVSGFSWHILYVLKSIPSLLCVSLVCAVRGLNGSENPPENLKLCVCM